MRLLKQLLVLPLGLLMVMSTSVVAQQQHAVEPGAIAGAVAQHVAAQDADRAAVRDALARPDVRDVASHMGVDLSRVDASVSTMSGADLQQAAAAARQVNSSLVGGASTIVISTTTVIIALLVIIIIVVAAK
jgi:hypothetical protein